MYHDPVLFFTSKGSHISSLLILLRFTSIAAWGLPHNVKRPYPITGCVICQMGGVWYHFHDYCPCCYNKGKLTVSYVLIPLQVKHSRILMVWHATSCTLSRYWELQAQSLFFGHFEFKKIQYNTKLPLPQFFATFSDNKTDNLTLTVKSPSTLLGCISFWQLRRKNQKPEYSHRKYLTLNLLIVTYYQWW